MSLIEQLAGYGECERLREVPAASSFRIRGIEFTREELERAMLEYRRQHNIFEVGDYVIDEQHTGLLRVTRAMKKRLDVDYLNPQTLGLICHHSILIRHIRHATDAEIAAGHRL